MRFGLVGGIAVVFTLVAVMHTGAALQQHVSPVHAHTGEVDLHALCESLARDCWDLDPLDFGMTPVATSPPPLPEGTLIEVEGSQDIQVKASLLGQRIHIHGVVTFEGGAAYHPDENTHQPVVPCGDPNGHCPDLMVDGDRMRPFLSTQTFSTEHCAVQEGSTEPGERKLLRFTFRSPNYGLGDLVVGDPDDHPEWFEWGNCHGHWHFKEYADYRLWDAAGYAAWKTIRTAYPHARAEEVLEAFPELRDHYRAGHKQGFCVIDLSPPPVFLERGKYDSCSDRQGISSGGWADIYHAFLDGQWVDVTDLEAGAYVLEAEVNPEWFFTEVNYVDNSAAAVVAIE